MSSALSFVKLEDDVTRKILELEKESPGTMNKIAVRLVIAFKDILRDDFMSGQILGQRTGMAKKNIYDNYVRKGTYHLPAPRLANIYETGAVVAPKDRKAIRFVSKSGEVVFSRGRVVLDKKPFWSTGWKTFVVSNAARKIVEEYLEKNWTRRFN